MLNRLLFHVDRGPSGTLAAAAGLALLVSGLVLSGCGGQGSVSAQGPGGQGRGRGRGDAAAAPVVVAPVVQKDVPIEIQVVGNVEAYSSVTVKAQVSGQLTNVAFQEGDFVKKEAPLFTVDPRIFEAQLAQSEANLARSTALMSQAEANLARDTAQQQYARSQAARYARLFEEKVVSKEQLDQITANADALTEAVKADHAAIESARAQANADRAAIANARVLLGYTSIRSPIDGRTGNLSMKLGNVVMANSTELVTINQVQPIYVTFAVPETRLAEIKRYMAAGKLPVTAKAQDSSAGEERGTLTFIDNAVDVSTGTIKLKATFSNAGRKLWPGQFVSVSMRLTTRPGALVVPNQAVQTGQEGQFVYVVKADQTVEARPVATVGRVDQDIVIEKGLAAGETVVTEGQLRLAPGSRVQVRTAGERPGRGPGRRP